MEKIKKFQWLRSRSTYERQIAEQQHEISNIIQKSEKEKNRQISNQQNLIDRLKNEIKNELNNEIKNIK
jgi:F0F1-type ATP synthase membrane subunit b/b'